ncbi:universal stress protein [Paraliomyxa miuraensis]|uniref:universal stress protein n=1 Tax=Paraliomyxa miuraensis TaxID=376150 RepID=UPI0022516190|nr:universal stress protein [Paraliomyxa miuraensis]MCX4246570.1 universal stress protein [Paraliomyxa miuraensis]
MSTLANRWIVGLDLRPTGQGALRFARWLAGANREGQPTFVGVHVLEEEHLRAALRYHHLEELVTGAREQAEMVVENALATDVVKELHVVQGLHAEQSLEAARVYHHAEGLVVGRQAPREGHHLLRLGKVARRLLRRLDGPVVVVPPDWEPEAVLDEAPIVCATNLGDAAVPAARYGAELAMRLGRTFVLVHAVPVPEDYGAHYIPAATRQKIAGERQADGERELASWVGELGITGAQQQVRQGHVTEQVLAVARETKAAMIITGSRRLSSMERLLLTSVGSELAATSPCPVAVVPPPR